MNPHRLWSLLRQALIILFSLHFWILPGFTKDTSPFSVPKGPTSLSTLNFPQSPTFTHQLQRLTSSSLSDGINHLLRLSSFSPHAEEITTARYLLKLLANPVQARRPLIHTTIGTNATHLLLKNLERLHRDGASPILGKVLKFARDLESQEEIPREIPLFYDGEKTHTLPETGLKTYPYWQDTVRIPVTAKEIPLPDRADVVVVGGGYTGLSAARTLAQHGTRVVLLEAQTFGGGASSRNAGMVLPMLDAPVESLIQKYGSDMVRRLYAISQASVEYVIRTIRNEGMDCDLSRPGHLLVARKPSHIGYLYKESEMMARTLGDRVTILTRENLRQEIGSSLYYGGLLIEDGFSLNPARYILGLVQAAAKAGALLYDQSSASHLERAIRKGESGYQIFTPRGKIWSREVLIATGGHTGNLTPQLQRRVIPIAAYTIATKPLPLHLIQELIPQGRMVYDTMHFLHYFRLTPDGRLLFGGRESFTPETAFSARKKGPRLARLLHQDMLKVFPQLKSTSVEYVWDGMVDYAFDQLPHAGVVDGLYYATGYSGHGITLGTYLGAKISQSLLGFRDSNPLEKLPIPQAPLGLYNGWPWFLPLAAAWYKFLDWLS